MNFDLLIEELIRDEGRVVKNGKHVAYKDHLGYLTIGYGTLIDERRGGGIPEHVAKELLRERVLSNYQGIRSALPFFDNLSDNTQRAINNMVYQLGLSGVLRFKKMIAALREGRLDAAADEALNSKWARQTPNRAKRIANMLRNG